MAAIPPVRCSSLPAQQQSHWLWNPRCYLWLLPPGNLGSIIRYGLHGIIYLACGCQFYSPYTEVAQVQLSYTFRPTSKGSAPRPHSDWREKSFLSVPIQHVVEGCLNGILSMVSQHHIVQKHLSLPCIFLKLLEKMFKRLYYHAAWRGGSSQQNY